MRTTISEGKRYFVMGVPRFSAFLIESLIILASVFLMGAAYGVRSAIAKLQPKLESNMADQERLQSRLTEIQQVQESCRQLIDRSKAK